MFLKLRQKEKENRQQLIVEAAETVFQQTGLDGLTLRKVAEEVGISTGTIYTYFKNKEELLLCILLNNVNILDQGLAEKLQEPEPLACLRSLAETYRAYYLRFGRYINVMDFLTKEESSYQTVSPHLIQALHELIGSILKRVEDRMAQADMQALFHHLPPPRASVLVWSVIQGISQLTLPSSVRAEIIDFQFEQVLNDIIHIVTRPSADQPAFP